MDRQKDVFEGIIGICLVFGSLPFIMSLLSTFLIFGFSETMGLTTAAMIYLASALSLYLFNNTKERMYLIVPAIWFGYVALSFFLFAALVQHMIGIVFMVSGIIYLYRVLD